MDELISKRAVIEAIEKARANVGHNLERSIGKSIIEILDDVGRDVDRLPSALGTNLAEVGTDAVSREAVKELAYSQIRSMYCGVALKEQRETMLRIADNVIGLLAPVTSAQPEIIRCRECKFASGDSRICMKFDHSPIGELDFCAWAERRTDG